MVSIERVYAAGSCNISKDEARLRLAAGWIGALLTVAAGAAFVLLGVPRGWRVVLFLPAVLGASGFLQAGLHFCANYGWRGVFNVKDAVGETQTITDPEFRKQDRRKALAIMGWSALIGVVVTVIDIVL